MFFDEKIADIRSSFTSTPPPPHPPPSVPSPCLPSFSPLTDTDVSQLLSHRPNTCTLDPIPSSLLQAIAPDILPFITSLVNSSLSSGYFPSSFKKAYIPPLLKKPTLDPSTIQNYRPLSLLLFISKTLEHAVSNQLSAFFSQNNLLDPHQSGFRSGHSTDCTPHCQIIPADSGSLPLLCPDSHRSFCLPSTLSTTPSFCHPRQLQESAARL